jgi:flagellar assembly factor FliW
MLICSAVFGEIEVGDDNLYQVPGGLFGFDDVRDYALVTRQDEDITLRWFMAASAQVPCFVVFNPYDIINGYEPEMEPSDLKALGAKNPGELDFLVIAVVPEDITKITLNLKSPIALNPKERRARQVLLRNDYPFKFPLVESPADD